MAVLEKIRKRGLLLTIVIGAALLAFILGDVLKNSSLFRDTSAAKVGGTKIDMTEYQQRYSELTSEENREQNQNRDQGELAQEVLNQLIEEKILDNEYEATGLNCSKAEFAAALEGDQEAQQFAGMLIQQLQANNDPLLKQIKNIASLDKIISSNKNFASVVPTWNKIKERVTKQVPQRKLYFLMGGSLQANDLDRAEILQGMDNYKVEMAKKDYASITDEKLKPTEKEIEAAYEQYKKLWKLDDKACHVHFIVTPVEASQKDIDALNESIEKDYRALQGVHGLDSVRFAGKYTKIESKKYTAQSLKDFVAQQRGDSAIAMIANAPAGTTRMSMLAGNMCNMYKVEQRTSAVDTVKIETVQVQGNKQLVDSVLNMLRAGKDVNSMKEVAVSPEQPIVLASQEVNINDTIKNKLLTANVGEYFVIDSNDKLAIICRINQRTAPQEIITLARITYRPIPSSDTQDDLRGKMQDFLNKNQTIDKFAKNAEKEGFMMREVDLKGSSPNMAGLPDSRKGVKWAFDSKEGQISPVMETNVHQSTDGAPAINYYYAVAVDQKYSGDYLPLKNPSVKQFCTEIALANKKGDALEAKYKGKATDIAGYAKLMEVEADSISIAFANDQTGVFDASPITGDAALIGRIVASKEGEVKFYKGKTAVYAYKVVAKEENKLDLKKEDLDQRFLSTRGLNQRNIDAIILGSEKIKNNLVNYQ